MFCTQSVLGQVMMEQADNCIGPLSSIYTFINQIVDLYVFDELIIILVIMLIMLT